MGLGRPAGLAVDRQQVLGTGGEGDDEVDLGAQRYVVARLAQRRLERQGAGGDHETLEVEGRERLSVYRAVIDGEESRAERNFCARCGAALWVWDPRWPELVHPFASAIDTELPAPPERVHLMLGSKAPWVPVEAGPEDKRFDGYPDESIADWHRRLGLEC
jgi:hypothetical protein